MAKKTLYIIAITIIGALYQSCNYLDIVPDNVATIENAFTNRANAEKYLFTCYSYLPAYGDVYANPAFMAGDEFWTYEEIFAHPEISAPASFRIARGTQNSNNPYVDYYEGRNGGKNLYKGIRCCNTFLEEIDQVYDMTDMEKSRWKAEARFLRAYYHFWMLRMYGAIDIVDNNLPVSTSPEDLVYKREPFDKCIDFIVQELDDISELLPLSIQNTIEEMGRITQPIVLAVKARVLITAASPQFNGNSMYQNFKNRDGEALFGAYDVNKWKVAAQACKEAIDIALQAGHSFYERDYSLAALSAETQLKMTIRGAVSDNWNKGIIWGASIGRASSIQNYCQAYLDPKTKKGGHINLFMAPTLRIAKQFYSQNGVPIDEDVDWQDVDIMKLRTASEDEKYYIKEGESTIQLHFDREPRFYASLGFNRGIWFGQGRTIEADSWVVQGYMGEVSSFYGERSSKTGYYAKKLVHPNNTAGISSYSREDYAFPIIRLSDLYLYYAEALNEFSGPSPDVYEAIDEVREHVGLNGIVFSWSSSSINPDKPSNKDGLREIIHQERLNELAFEGQRFWDLNRWLKQDLYMNKPIKGWNVNGTDAADFYQETVLFTPHHTPKDYLWPIREYILTINENMVQTIGW
ncbi:RagB/SusD family nutrient uptake outer membrane protein [Sunxiuqinia rutila]|uniref:RagB/SusD family nutrient uptake outer membrane protein n=1 Tax=Sunxiuqinia rutila TaxID=1397841 RepID=UPI003D35BEAA